MQRSPLKNCGLAAFFLLVLTAAGCASHSDDAPPVDAAGKHPAGWTVAHRAAYQNAPALCGSCHGADLSGGIAKVDCFNQGNLPSCHASGHGPRFAPHAVPFTDPALHGAAASADLVGCQLCHGEAGGAGTNPRFSTQVGSLSSGCEASGCHNLADPALPAVSSAHPVPWRGHAGAGNQLNACALCHGATFQGGSGPACSGCHTLLAAGTLPAPGICSSCHASSPVTGSHTAHRTLAGVSCASCHDGGGAGGVNHGSGSTLIAFQPPWSAKSGVATRNQNGSCSLVSCHGGITTPLWGGSLDVASQCTSCHGDGTGDPANPPEFNSYRSGRHALHVAEGLACSDCHDMTVTAGGASHFGALATPSFELPAAATVRGYLNYNPAGPSCLAPGIAPAGNTVGACHTGARTW